MNPKHHNDEALGFSVFWTVLTFGFIAFRFEWISSSAWLFPKDYPSHSTVFQGIILTFFTSFLHRDIQHFFSNILALLVLHARLKENYHWSLFWLIPLLYSIFFSFMLILTESSVTFYGISGLVFFLLGFAVFHESSRVWRFLWIIITVLALSISIIGLDRPQYLWSSLVHLWGLLMGLSIPFWPTSFKKIIGLKIKKTYVSKKKS